MSGFLGKINYNINVSEGFRIQSISDERAANILFENGAYKQSSYYIIQAMEKLIRSKIFTLVDARNEYFRDRNRTHSLEDAADFLIDILGTNEVVKKQVSNQLYNFVLGDTKYNYLHNNLRYPFYSKKFNSYSSLDFEKSDANILLGRLGSLKKFLKDIDYIS